MPAKVYLIGAGPGDPGLLTIKGAKCLAEADVVIYDYLSNTALLEHASPSAKLIYVGKKGFSEHVTQEQINECIIAEAIGDAPSAQESSTVVARLKGGDPFVFGRGGEEALALKAAGIAYEVVPGVTSGIAAPAYAGIPVTHRGVSSSVAFITGNEDPTKPETSIDWKGLANGAQTLCFYMGVKNLPSIAENLVKAGRDAQTPVALVRWGTTAAQEVLTGTLADIAIKAVAANFKAPAIILVGDVASLRGELEWFEKPPLAGTTIAVTRARTQASELVRQLREFGANVVECPTIEVRELDDYSAADAAIASIRDAAKAPRPAFDWLVLTSTNGVEHFFARLAAAGLDTRALAGAKVAAIGAATAAELGKHGIAVDLVPAQYRAEAVVVELLERGVGSDSRVLIARAQEARDVLPDELAKHGVSVTVVPLYRTVAATGDATARALEQIVAGNVEAITFTSTSTVKNFMKLLEEHLRSMGGSLGLQGDGAKEQAAQILNDLCCYSIGPVTSATIQEFGGIASAEASPYTIPALVQAIVGCALE